MGRPVQRGHHALVADGLQISSLSPQGAVLVDVQDKSHLKVTAQGGSAEVRNPGRAHGRSVRAGESTELYCAGPQQDSPQPHRSRIQPLGWGASPTPSRRATDTAWHSAQGPSWAIWALSAHRHGDERNL